MEVILLERVGQARPYGRHRARQGRLRPQFPAAARQGLARDRERTRRSSRASAPISRCATQQLKATPREKSTKLDGKSFIIIRQAGETGQLYGSVSARDIAETMSAAAGFPIHRNQISLLQPIKTLGLHKTPVHLHPEVEAHVTINVARSPEQAERQAKGEDLTVREETSMDDLGLEVGKALAEAGPGESLARE